MLIYNSFVLDQFLISNYVTTFKKSILWTKL